MRIRRSYITRQIALFLVAPVSTVVIVPTAGQFFISLAEEHGWYQNPSAKLGAVIAFFAAIASSPLFHWVGGVIIGFAGAVWLDVMLKRRDEGEGPIRPAEVSITPSHAPLTFEEKQFRLELRKFVSSLDESNDKLRRVFVDILQRDQNTNQDDHKHERYFASNSISVIGNVNSINSLKSLTQVNIDEMDVDAIEYAVVTVITNYYRIWQLHIWMFNQIAKIDIDHLDSLRIWLDADLRCVTALHELQSYPQAKAIKQAVDAHMGIGRLWATGQ